MGFPCDWVAIGRVDFTYPADGDAEGLRFARVEIWVWKQNQGG